MSPIVMHENQRPAALKVVGEEITVLAPGSTTGSYEIFRQAGPEGSGPPPHNHGWDEAFYVTAGEIVFGLEGQDDVVARAGTFVHVPGGTTHFFRFGAGGGEMISMVSRAGASEFFTEVAREVSPVDPDLGALIGIAQTHGLTFPN
jgi:quercetin dioxygenase-like cupin family protein